ncbi:hypothetical protein G3N30_16910, partial [Microbacterium lacticum]|nr:hypothetical protein [Microbacterium lacticum]
GTVAGKSFSALAFTQVLQLLNTQLAEYDDAIAAATAEWAVSSFVDSLFVDQAAAAV